MLQINTFIRHDRREYQWGPCSDPKNDLNRYAFFLLFPRCLSRSFPHENTKLSPRLHVPKTETSTNRLLDKSDKLAETIYLPKLLSGNHTATYSSFTIASYTVYYIISAYISYQASISKPKCKRGIPMAPLTKFSYRKQPVLYREYAFYTLAYRSQLRKGAISYNQPPRTRNDYDTAFDIQSITLQGKHSKGP
jgi:hypothetical protein